MKLRKTPVQVNQRISTKIFTAALNNSNINQTKVDKYIMVYLDTGMCSVSPDSWLLFLYCKDLTLTAHFKEGYLE